MANRPLRICSSLSIIPFSTPFSTLFYTPLLRFTFPIAPPKPDIGAVQEVKEIEQKEQVPAKLPPMEEAHIDALEEILGHKFSDRYLVEEAMTHGSAYYPLKGEMSYERLEFMGDAVLTFGVASEVFFTYPNLAPGPMTRLRAANVDKEKLARIAVAHGLHRYLRHKAPQLESQINQFVDDLDNYPIHSNGLLDPPKVLADIVESLLGAVYVDTNKCYETVWKIFMRLSRPFITIETLGKHPVTELHELCQKLHNELKFNDKKWAENLTVDVLLNGKVIGSATYGPKKDICHNRAAKVALDRLKELLSNGKLEIFLKDNT
ncbi:dicer-like 3 [Rhynchospora pubera]|uniref:Dicer-like 3 n=1 Tax=Rhynchospora pubera TaxID=906938 RepID=A0AAV8FC85_9POAL|nr:dicer-like 3 [Rhynchospora pubera]